MTVKLQPMLFAYDPEREAAWVDAMPFRAHLGHLLAAGLTEPVIAQLSGVSLRAVQHLAHGRNGRQIRRVCGDTGRRLLRITTAEARAIRFRPVPVKPSRLRLRAMAAAGWTVDRLVATTGLGSRDVEAVLGRGSATCSQVTALTIAAVFEQWETEQEFAGIYAAVA